MWISQCYACVTAVTWGPLIRALERINTHTYYIKQYSQANSWAQFKMVLLQYQRQLAGPKSLTFVCNTSSSNRSSESRSAGGRGGHPGEEKPRCIQLLQPQRSRWHREVCFPIRRRCRDTGESHERRDPLSNPPLSQCMWTNFVLIYFRGCPRPQNISTQKFIIQKFPNTKISQITLHILYIHLHNYTYGEKWLLPICSKTNME